MGGSAERKHDPSSGAATWRFSCFDPNAQQVPPAARNLFIPDESDWEMMSVDLTQAEVCGLLWIAEEWEVLDKVINGGFDAHTALAEQIEGRELAGAGTKGHPDKKIRDNYKNTTFAMMFGEGPRTTAMRTGKPIGEINAAREFYFKMLPGIEDYRIRTIQFAMTHGYAESPFGFRRYVRVTEMKGRAANQICNAPIQNIPPVVMGYAMIKLHEQLPAPARLLMQVHDELVLTYPRNLRDVVADAVYSIVRDPVRAMPAPAIGQHSGLRFRIDLEVGRNWKDQFKCEYVDGSWRTFKMVGQKKVEVDIWA
jgi:DNA polymerase-1